MKKMLFAVVTLITPLILILLVTKINLMFTNLTS